MSDHDVIRAILGLDHETDEQGRIHHRPLEDGRVLEVWPLTFGRARLHLTTYELGFPDSLAEY